MRVISLAHSAKVYTSNVHLILGDWSGLADLNSLVDVGRDPAVLDSLSQAPTGVGKQPVEQVVLTHGHYDHVGLLGVIRQRFQPRVLAFDGALEGVDRALEEGDELKAGDTPLLVCSMDGSYEERFAAAIERICARDVRVIYFGHGPPLIEGCNLRLRRSLEIVSKSLQLGSGLSENTRKVNCEVVL